MSSPKKLSQKERVELEPFHLVMVDGFEGFDEVDGHDSGHRYLLRFVCASTGHRKSYSCLNKTDSQSVFACTWRGWNVLLL